MTDGFNALDTTVNTFLQTQYEAAGKLAAMIYEDEKLQQTPRHMEMFIMTLQTEAVRYGWHAAIKYTTVDANSAPALKVERDRLQHELIHLRAEVAWLANKLMVETDTIKPSTWKAGSLARNAAAHDTGWGKLIRAIYAKYDPGQRSILSSKVLQLIKPKPEAGSQGETK